MNHHAQPEEPVSGAIAVDAKTVDHRITDLYLGGLYSNRDGFAPQQSSYCGKQLKPGPLFFLRDPGTGKEYAVGFGAGLHTCGVSKDKVSSEICNASGGTLLFYAKNEQGQWQLCSDAYAVFQFLGTMGARVVGRMRKGVLLGLQRALPRVRGDDHGPGRILATLDGLYKAQSTKSTVAYELHGRLVVAVLYDLAAAMLRDWNERGVWTDRASYPDPAEQLPDAPTTAPVPLPTGWIA